MISAPAFAFFGYYSDPAMWKPITPNNSGMVLTGKPVPQITVAETPNALKTVTEKSVFARGVRRVSV